MNCTSLGGHGIEIKAVEKVARSDARECVVVHSCINNVNCSIRAERSREGIPEAPKWIYIRHSTSIPFHPTKSLAEPIPPNFDRYSRMPGRKVEAILTLTNECLL